MRLPAIHPLAAAILVAALAVSPGSAQAPPVPGTWQTLAPLPDLRAEFGVATDGNLIFVAGGFSRSIFGLGVSPRAVYAFDPAVNGWSFLTELPQGVNHNGLIYLDGALYVVGGYREISLNPLGRLMVFDFASGMWFEGPRLPTPRGAMAVVALDGRIHAIGGTLGNDVSTGIHEVYDPRTRTWSRAADLPTPRNHVAAVAVGGEIIVLGGRNEATFELTANEIWSPRTNSWRTAAPVPTGRSGIAAAELDGFVYLLGGETQDAEDRAFDEVERYDPATDRWATLPPMLSPRHGHGAATVGDFVYVMGGGMTPGGGMSNVHERLFPH